VKTVRVVRLVEREDSRTLPELPEELNMTMTEVAGAGQEGCLAMNVAVACRSSAAVRPSRSASSPSSAEPAWPITPSSHRR
jgi:hypothetical protein